MPKPLRAIIVEDSEDDCELLLHELRRGGYEPIHARVETAEALSDVLGGRTWDVLFSDFTMPQFNAFDALALLRSVGLDIPFIIVSGTIGEDRAVTAMRAGAHDYILKGNLKRLVPAVERELREARVRQERREAEETIRRLAYVDPVTELPNRVQFREILQKAIEQAKESAHASALLLMDLQHFREVNDTLGHNRGDALLRQVGRRLRSVLFEPDVVARLGGDEFGILLPRLAAVDDIRMVIDKLQSFLEAPFVIDGIPIAVEASVGIAIAPDHAGDADTLLQRADIAMYRAKRLGSEYAIYAREDDPHSPDRLALMGELRGAIEQNQLLLHFQPKVELRTGSIIGAEALVRWQHPARGLLMPDTFIIAAEQTGLIGPLSRWVLTEAMNRCQAERQRGVRLNVSVNLSARNLHDPKLPEMVQDVLRKTGAEAGQLTLEVTESAIVLDPNRAVETLTKLSGMGVRLSIDDFGTGYTSLASIKDLPVHEIKIDKSFVSGISEKKNAMIVRSVIELGHNLGLKVVGEGVETREVFDTLAALGCDEIQGYFVSRPQTYEALAKWLGETDWKFSGKN